LPRGLPPGVSPLPDEDRVAVVEERHHEGGGGGLEPAVGAALTIGPLDLVPHQRQPAVARQLPRAEQAVRGLVGVVEPGAGAQTLGRRSSSSRAERCGTPSRKASTRKAIELSIASSSGSLSQSSISSF